MGSLLGGPLFERYGGALTFRMFGASAIVLLVTYLVCQKFCVQHTEREEVTTSETAKGRSYSRSTQGFSLIVYSVCSYYVFRL